MSKRGSLTTVVIADDDPTIRRNLRVLLESEGYQVRESVDGLQAADTFDDPSVALMLLDLKMPGRDGMDVLRDHQDQLEEMPVIVWRCRQRLSRIFGSGPGLATCVSYKTYSHVPPSWHVVAQSCRTTLCLAHLLGRTRIAKRRRRRRYR